MSSHLMLSEVDMSNLPAGSFLVEIGSQREPLPFESDEHSTGFLYRLAESLGLGFVTVDFSSETYRHAYELVGEKAVNQDGAEFITRFDQRICVLYLDNFDVIHNEDHWESLKDRLGDGYQGQNAEITNERSADVHLAQAMAATHLLTTPSYVCIDDTMVKNGQWWGKGVKALPYLVSIGYRAIQVGDEGVLLSR